MNFAESQELLVAAGQQLRLQESTIQRAILALADVVNHNVAGSCEPRSVVASCLYACCQTSEFAKERPLTQKDVGKVLNTSDTTIRNVTKAFRSKKMANFPAKPLSMVDKLSALQTQKKIFPSAFSGASASAEPAAEVLPVAATSSHQVPMAPYPTSMPMANHYQYDQATPTQASLAATVDLEAVTAFRNQLSQNIDSLQQALNAHDTDMEQDRDSFGVMAEQWASGAGNRNSGSFGVNRNSGSFNRNSGTFNRLSGSWGAALQQHMAAAAAVAGANAGDPVMYDLPAFPAEMGVPVNGWENQPGNRCSGGFVPGVDLAGMMQPGNRNSGSINFAYLGDIVNNPDVMQH